MFSKWYRSALLAPFAASVLVLVAPPASRADVVVTVEAPGVQASTRPGVITETFNSLAPGSYTTINSPIGTYTAPTPGLAVVSPNAFGGAFQTRYMAVGAQSGQTEADLTFASPQSYFGLYWSAIDTRNILEVFNGATLLNALTRSDLSPLLQTTGGPNGHGHYGNPNTGADASEPFVYVNLTGTNGTTFTEIKFLNSGTGTGFESDNHSIAAVPEPGPLALSAVASALGVLGYWRRRRASA